MAAKPGVLTGRAGRLRIALASSGDLEAISRVRHRVYATELGQHAENGEGRLSDSLDGFNLTIVATIDGEVAGFVSLTPPGHGRYGIDKYLRRDQFPFPFDDRLYEVRLLTVVPARRGGPTAFLLMYAALRRVEAHGGARIVAIGRREVLGLYLEVGLERLGLPIRSGAVAFEAITATVDGLRCRLSRFAPLLERLEGGIDWQLGVPFHKPAPCFHGGAFFEAVGDGFEDLDRRKGIINADVLDAWFPPSPKVLRTLEDHLPWLVGTSPPTGSEGMIRAIACARGVAPENVLPGAGSSDLIFLAFRHWLTSASRVLLLDPTYGEYAHLLEKVIRCRVDRMLLERSGGYRLDPSRLACRLDSGYDAFILVNPNSPTGRHVPRRELESVLSRAPAGTRVWVDETYVEYAGPGESLEPFAATSENVVVCKSMSKVYALSGVRAAYLCASPHQLEALRSATPPWAVSLPAQVAAVKALEDPDYYAARYRETHVLRDALVASLRGLGLETVPGVANFVFCHLPEEAPDAAGVVAACRRRGLFLRDAAGMGTGMGRHALRLAVKDADTNRRMLGILSGVLKGDG